MPDPKLKAAMEEIKAVLRRHDIAAVVTLQSPGALEYLYELSPSWSCIHIEPGGAVRIRAQAKTGPATEKERLRLSAGMIVSFADLGWRAWDDFTKLTRVLGQHVEIEHVSREDVNCPACAHSMPPDAFPAAIRNGKDELGRNISDVGWRCPACSQEFGFEVLGP